jgi:hypothetical protein
MKQFLVIIIILFTVPTILDATIQQYACLATHTAPCPDELPIQRDDNKLDNYGGSRTMGANTGAVIYLRSSLNLDRCYGKQYLFHENVNTTQNARRMYDHDAREAEAYKLQNEYYVRCMNHLGE